MARLVRNGTTAALLTLALSGALAIGCGDDEESPMGQAPTAPRTEPGDQPPAEQPGATPTETETQPDTPSETLRCGDVAFEEQTDFGAFDITAVGVACEDARAVARGAEEGDNPYTRNGFTCEGERQETELPTVAYTCTRDDGARVTFTSS